MIDEQLANVVRSQMLEAARILNSAACANDIAELDDAASHAVDTLLSFRRMLACMEADKMGKVFPGA